MTKILNKDLLDSEIALVKLFEAKFTDIKLLQKFSKFKKQVTEKTKEVLELRNKLINQYGEKDDKGNVAVKNPKVGSEDFEKDKENLDNFYKDYNVIADDDSGIKKIEIKIELLSDIKLSTFEFSALEKVINFI